MVELSLGLLAFIPILLFGIHYAEVAVLDMKLTEAAAAPLWDAATGKLHRLPYSYLPEATAAVANAQSQAFARYSQMGHSTSGGATNVFTQVSTFDLKCQLNRPLPFAIAPALSGPTAVFQDNGGVSCGSTAFFSIFRMPDHFADGAPFSASIKDGVAAVAGMRRCAVGRPLGLTGACDGDLAMLIDDWGLTSSRPGDPSEQGGEECRGRTSGSYNQPCANTNYYEAAHRAFENSGKNIGLAGGGQPSINGPASKLVQAITSGVPFSEEITGFYLSYRGEESPSPFVEIAPAHGGDNDWETTPVSRFHDGLGNAQYGSSYGKRQPCYLGHKC
jgi:hypothetical protein